MEKESVHGGNMLKFIGKTLGRDIFMLLRSEFSRSLEPGVELIRIIGEEGDSRLLVFCMKSLCFTVIENFNNWICLRFFREGELVSM